MAKFKIAQNPTFKADVRIPRVGGEPVKVGFEFKYLDRIALSEMFDGWNKARDELAKRVKDESLTWKDATAAEIELQVQQIKDITVGWAFDDEFSDESIAALVRTSIDAPAAVIEAYQASYHASRLGN